MISKTRKRLSSDTWSQTIFLVSILSLILIYTFLVRAVSLPAKYGVVRSELPVLSVPIEDPGFYRFSENPDRDIDRDTPIIIISKTGFFYGEIQAFSSGFGKSNNKFKISHKQGVPQLGQLLYELEHWLLSRSQRNNAAPFNGIAVFLPADDVPMPIVIEVLAQLKSIEALSHVVLGGALI